MKGIVFTEFLEMVEERFSLDVADQIIEASELPSGGSYTAVGTYHHSEMVTLVVKLSEVSGLPVPALIKAFGSHLFGRFAVLYPRFFEGATDAFDFLFEIENVIHAEVRKLYPDAQLPRFDVSRPAPGRLELLYHSERHFGDLAEGLITACLAYFGDAAQLERENLDEPGQPVRFVLTRP